MSDGVQSLITELFPEGIYLAVETSGDGAVNVQSRVQMQVFKARKAAARDLQRALDETGQDLDQVRTWLARNPRVARALHHSPQRRGCTAADLVYDVAERQRPLLLMSRRMRRRLLPSADNRTVALDEVARRMAIRRPL
ncbi:MAG: hypothetical protein JRG90_22920 [Deltaproteobacteria bacterium]|nr:hypothetical protein [Deltaproteobacteria bacterium]